MKKKLLLSLAFLVVVAIVAGIVVLSRWKIPPPPGKVEMVLPDDRFPK